MSLSVDIRKSFGSFTLNVAFDAGKEVLGFLGASGCGKSLTLRCIAGIETPDEGQIVVNGTTFFHREAGKRPDVNLTPQERKTALLFQNYQLFPNLTVAQNIAAGIAKDTSKEETARMASSQMERFGLQGMQDRYPLQLSGGQQQRVALARMLAANPGILMLDEPFSALDSHLKSSLEQSMARLFEDFDGTILYVSHDIDEAFRFCDRIAVVDNGQISDIGPKQHLIEDPQSLAALRLSGCRNTTEAVRVDNHHVTLPHWGITVTCAKPVPQDVCFLGVRAFMLQQAPGPEENAFAAKVVRISDARFDSTVALRFLGEDEPDEPAGDFTDSPGDFTDSHIQWRVNTLEGRDALPAEGQTIYLRIPPEKVYLVCR